jgi:hypothetical protein
MVASAFSKGTAACSILRKRVRGMLLLALLRRL